jgi:hypothetical protein
MYRTTYLAPYTVSASLFRLEASTTHKAISHRPNLLVALFLQQLDCLFNNWIDSTRIMRTLPITSSLPPSRKIKARWTVQWNWISFHNIRHYGVVAISCILVGYQLRVLPYTDHVGDEYDCDFGVRGRAVGGGCCYVGVEAAGKLGSLAGGCATDIWLAMLIYRELMSSLEFDTNCTALSWISSGHCLRHIASKSKVSQCVVARSVLNTLVAESKRIRATRKGLLWSH